MRLNPTGLSSHAALWVILGVGALLRLATYLAATPLFVDEAALALNLLNRSYAGLLAPLSFDQAGPVGFLFAERFMLSVLGSGELALRLVPVAAGIASLPLFLLLANRTGTRLSRPIACALFAVAPTLVYFAGIAKQYTLDVLVAIVLYLLVLDATGELRPARRLAVFSLAGAVAVWFSHPSIFVLAGILAVQLLSLAKQRSGKGAGGLLLFHAAWLGSFLTLYLVNLSRAAQSDYLRAYWHAHFAPFPPGGLADLQWYGSRFLGLFKIPLGLSVLIGLGALVFLYGAIVLYRRAPRTVLLLLAPLLMAGGASALSRYPFEERFLLFFAPALALFMGEGIAALFDYRLARVPLLGGATAALLIGGPLALSLREIPYEISDVSALGHHVQSHRRAGDVLYLHCESYATWTYYDQRLGFSREMTVVVGDSLRSTSDYLGEVERLRAHDRVWVLFGHVRSVGGYSDDLKLLLRLDVVGERLDEKKAGSSGGVYLYDLAAGLPLPAAARPAARRPCAIPSGLP
ncbi:MAG: hypothetical protein ABR559_04205 [Gemmatimonadota bacterium]